MRRWRPDPIPREVLARVLETATYAPSAHNRQPWRFAALTSPEAKTRLAEALGEVLRQALAQDALTSEEIAARVERSRRRIGRAPAAVVLCADFTAAAPYPDEERQAADNLMLVQDATLAGGTLLLAAHAEGLGGVWMCAPLFAPETTREALGLPESWEPLALILLGYPENIPAARARKALDEVARFY